MTFPACSSRVQEWCSTAPACCKLPVPPALDCLQDQCRREMAAGHIFRYMREGTIAFKPTYKFDKVHPQRPHPDFMQYDTSEKRRVPAWTDRIFYRGSAFASSGMEVGPYKIAVFLCATMAWPEPVAQGHIFASRLLSA